MKAFDSEDRDALVSDLAMQLLRDWNRKLLAGERRALSDLQNVILDRLSEDDCKAIFVRAAVHQSGNDLNVMAARAMYDRCLADAEKSVGIIERMKEISRDESRIAQVEASRSTV
jgi:hypothetical protein